MTEQAEPGRASAPFDMPDHCPSCNAPLKAADTQFEGTKCPHCGYELAKTTEPPSGA